jgi:hypothetical protein
LSRRFHRPLPYLLVCGCWTSPRIRQPIAYGRALGKGRDQVALPDRLARVAMSSTVRPISLTPILGPAGARTSGLSGSAFARASGPAGLAGPALVATG